jgi:hypothetical protein
LLLSDAEKATLAEIADRLGRKALEGLAAAAKPDTLLAWYRMLIAHKFDGSKCLVVRMARENPRWGYDRIVRMYQQFIDEQRIFGQLTGDPNESEFAGALEQGFRSGGWKGAVAKGNGQAISQVLLSGHFTSLRRLFALPRGRILSVMAIFAIGP